MQEINMQDYNKNIHPLFWTLQTEIIEKRLTHPELCP
jgi:hypothetical protein